MQNLDLRVLARRVGGGNLRKVLLALPAPAQPAALFPVPGAILFMGLRLALPAAAQLLLLLTLPGEALLVAPVLPFGPLAQLLFLRDLAGDPRRRREPALDALLHPAGAALGAFAKRIELHDQIELALQGDTVALRLCLERNLPPRKDRPVTGIEIPALKTAADALAATGALFDAVAAGDITPSEAAELGKLVDTFVRSTESLELEQRIARLEEGLPK
ncbi:hypothetical protein WDZ92_30960 [Nostoc sp. NIES-2111]